MQEIKMKKMVRTFMVSLLGLFTMVNMAIAAQYTEGKQYTTVSETATSKSEIREYFSVYCPHCLRFEPFMQQVKKQLPEGMSFERNHVDFLRGASPKIQQMVTKAIVVAEQLEDTDKYIGAIFNYIQVQRAVVTSEKDLRNIFVLNGADGAQFDKLMASFTVKSKAQALKENQDAMAAKGAIKGVPAIFVNGKYRINYTELDKNNFEQDFHNLVKYLAELD